jgi:hypothetical protein
MEDHNGMHNDMSALWTQSGRLITDANGAPIWCDTCPCETALGDLRIDDYVDGDIPFADCAQCDIDSTETPWDGTLLKYSDTEWVYGKYGLGEMPRSIDGKAMDYAHLKFVLGRWDLRIECQSVVAGGNFAPWYGNQSTGPVNTYLKTTPQYPCITTPTALVIGNL